MNLTLLIMFWNLFNFQPDSITVNQDDANKTTILALLDLGSLFDIFDHIIRILHKRQILFGGCNQILRLR